MHDILVKILTIATPGLDIPKPSARGAHKIKGWGRRRNERALIYKIPNHSKPSSPHEKGVTESEWEQAFGHLMSTSEFSRTWFVTNMVACNKEGSCNFTTIGGIFELLGYAKHEPSLYRKT